MDEEHTTKRTVTFPPSDNSWLSPKRVDYLSKLLQVFFLALALPYLFVRFVRNTTGTLAGATSIHAAA